MITLDDVERIHEILIDKFEGKKELRDKGLLESSIKRPFQTFDQKELYPNPVDKAAALLKVLYQATLSSTVIKGRHM
jgi:death-on-curing protein